MEPRLLFASAAAHYRRYRNGYGEEVIGHIARELSLGARSRVLDLGCGPGTLAIPLSRYAGTVTAVDPSDDMLAEGAREAPAGIRWIRGDSGRLAALPLGRVDHVVMGRSFHWMERARVLADLDAMLPPDGAVVLVGPGRDPVEPPWEPVVQTVRRRFDIEWRLNGKEGFQQSGRHHADVVAESAFGDISTATFRRTVRRDIEQVIGLQLSFSFSTPARLGDRLPGFVEALDEALSRAEPGGSWAETVETEVLIARRPRAGQGGGHLERP
ncbi:methyltransferase [Sphaerisporangium melleum]|uniref:Methyltransferase n=1 Tax=Sphaerisporangium melleum TaxID=321316 RepID=A0A917R5H2_9ACTN|nr:class I SAM-dependent methyltransferase [Sphaerisporangium melleum]GGK90279.1 methyltransferase [Sphaerisporangium melleum]GII72883.1 methyltransferase [Sphaerisporangium melleum]